MYNISLSLQRNLKSHFFIEMVLLGWNTVVLRQVKHKDMLCPVCSHKGHITLFLMCRVYHFFFIPFFPDNRYIYAICDHCKEEINEVDADKQDRILFKTKSYKERSPFTAWSGLFLLLLVIIYFSFR